MQKLPKSLSRNLSKVTLSNFDEFSTFGDFTKLECISALEDYFHKKK